MNKLFCSFKEKKYIVHVHEFDDLLDRFFFKKTQLISILIGIINALIIIELVKSLFNIQQIQCYLNYINYEVLICN